MKWSWLDLGRQNRPWNSCRMKWSPQQWGNYSIIHNIKHMPRVRNATSKIREIDVGVQLLEMQVGRHCPDRPEVPQTPNDPMCPNVLRAFFLVHCIYIYIYIMLQCSFRYPRNKPLRFERFPTPLNLFRNVSLWWRLFCSFGDFVLGI